MAITEKLPPPCIAARPTCPSSTSATPACCSCSRSTWPTACGSSATSSTPGATVQTHKHTGHVYAFTQSGSWHYLESPDAVNVAGSYLYEPAGSTHTLHVPATNTGITDVWFTIHGANLNLGADGQVEMVIDAHADPPHLPAPVRRAARHRGPAGDRHRHVM